MVKKCKRNPKKRRKQRLSRTKLLCAVALTFCDFTSTDAAKSEQYGSDQRPFGPNHNVHGTPRTSLSAIDKNKTSPDVNLDMTASALNLGSDIDEASNRHSNIPSNSQHETSRYSRAANPSNYVSDTRNQPLSGLPRPPPPQWINDNRYVQPQANARQPSYTRSSQVTFDTRPSTQRHNRDDNPNIKRDTQIAPSQNNHATNIRAQRRVPLHLLHATSERRQNYIDTQQRSLSPTLLHYENSQDDMQNNRHARSYQSRIMPYHSEHQKSIPEPNSNERGRTQSDPPFNKVKWTRAAMEDQQYNQFSVTSNRSGIRSLREPMINQYARGIPMSSSKSKKMLDTNLRSEIGPTSDDPNAIRSIVPTSSNSQLALVSPFLHESIFDEQVNQVQSLVEAGAWMSFGSIQKISWCILAISLLSYAAVSPSTLPLTDYNLQFYENLRIVCLSTIAPAIYMLLVFDPRENDVNSVTNVFVLTFFFGYTGIYILELTATTIVRLLLFIWLEPNVFSLMPRIPLPVLPWVLREWQYRPKRITLFAADFATSCIACPIIEEYVKFFLLQRTSKLPRNFRWVDKSSDKRKTKKRVAEIIKREYGEYDCTSANRYVINMLAISVALKLADAARRILLYTKPTDANKGFYAVCRGIFPIHELCGAMIAIALAKRDLLGMDIPRWKILAPAIVVHAMANFRGKRPIFKWNASAPWSEMQLSPLNIPDSSTFLQLVKKGYAKLMWIVTISRVFGYCVKNYYMVNRHALKRTTKYAGNHAAFSAELVTAESLKNLKKTR